MGNIFNRRRQNTRSLVSTVHQAGMAVAIVGGNIGAEMMANFVTVALPLFLSVPLLAPLARIAND